MSQTHAPFGSPAPSPAESSRDLHSIPPSGGSPVTPGKVAMWLFLATEVMFFTGLIGSYIVLRAGSPSFAYSNILPPNRLSSAPEPLQFVGLGVEVGNADPARILEIVRPVYTRETRLNDEAIRNLIASGRFVVPGIGEPESQSLARELVAAGATVAHVPLVTSNWPRPYDEATNPLSIDLTAVNTFILICSSLTMVLALSAAQRGDRNRLRMFLLATLVIGGTFLGIQVYEYQQLMFEHVYPIGVSATGHFTPDVSLFASCFFTMTGFHGAHVAAGLVALLVVFFQSLRGIYTPAHHGAVELVGLYWHFVDLVWIILFTVVYLI